MLSVTGRTGAGLGMGAKRAWAIGIVVGAILPFFSALAAEPELTPFRVGESAPANTYLAIWMADEAGFYAKEGLSVESVPMAGGSLTASELEAGNIQLMHIGMSTVIRANAAGSDLKIVGSLSNVIRFTFFAAPGIENADSLRGGVIGISSTGSESDATANLALERLGLTREDIRIEEIGRDRLPALRNGAISATMLGEPERSEAFAEGLTPLIDLYAEHIPWLFSGLVVDGSYLATHRDTVKRFLRATIEGNYLAINDPMRAREVLARKLGLSDADVISNFRDETPANAEIDLLAAQNVLASVGGAGIANGVDEYIDTSIHSELMDEGLLAAEARGQVAQ